MISMMESDMTRARGWTGARWLLVAQVLAVLGVFAAAPLDAQEVRNRSPFNLAASRDFAVTGMRAGSGHRIWVSNAGVIDAQQQMQGLGALQVQRGTSFYSQVSEITLWATTGPRDYNAALPANPSLANARGDGYTVAFNLNVTPEHLDWGPRDGALGFLHRGVRTPAPGQAAAACLNHASDLVPPGLTLMPGSDCPDTWGIDGWLGDRPISFSTWRRLQEQQGNSFRFDFAGVPDELKEEGFLGDNFSTFGVINDYTQEVRQRYGSVLAGGSGAPQAAGYPLGLEWKFDAFNMTSLPGVVFWQATVTNKSNEIYNQGIDYHDLRLGFMLRHPRIRARAGYDVQRGAVVLNHLGHKVTCDSARAIPATGFATEAFFGNCSSARDGTQGFLMGSMALVFLKSPIGDLRNKLLSDPGSAFYQPGNLAAGDTITFNIGRACGDACIGEQFRTDNPRRAYGVLASNEADALAGRPPNSLEVFDYWNLFHPANGYPYGDGAVVDLSDPRAGGGFNYAVPGAPGSPYPVWDYNHDGQPDTLFIDMCNPTTHECASLWSDTFPDRSINFIWKQVWVGVGPIDLPVGASTSFVLAVIARPDSVSMEQAIDNAITLYRNFFVAPTPAPAPRVIAAHAGAVGETRSASVTFTLDMRTGRWVDPYLEFLATEIRNAAPGTPAAELRDLNPWLPDSLLGRAQNPVRRILVYKSCNPDATTLVYTSSASASACVTGVVRDSLGAVKGPSAYAQITNLDQTTYTDGNVAAGQNYLYAFVPETYGARFPIVRRAPDGTTFVRDSVFAAPSAPLPATKAAPNVAVVYIPASRQAGGAGAGVEYVRETDGSTIHRQILPELGPGRPVVTTWGDVIPSVVDSVSTSQTIRVIFGDTLVVRDYGPAGSVQVDSTRIEVVRTVITDFTYAGALATRTATPVRERADVRTFTARKSGGIPVNAAGAVDVETDVVGDQRVDTRRLVGGAIVVSVESGGERPLFVSNVMPTATTTFPQFTPVSFLSSDEYRGVSVTVLSRAASPATFRQAFYLDNDSLQLNPVITTPVSLAWVTGGAGLASRGLGTGHGQYEIKFADTEFGPHAPFPASLGAAGLSDALAASLGARAVASRTVVDAATAAAVSRALGIDVTEADLVSVTLPFTVRNASYDRPVTVAMLRADKQQTALFGSGIDTVRVNVPADHWMPGERLIFLEDVELGTVSGGTVTMRNERTVTFYPATLGCGTAVTTVNCNPITGRGQTGWTGVTPGFTLITRYAIPLRSGKEFEFNVVGARSGSAIASISKADMDAIKVVPNPYVMFSTFEQQRGGSARIMFTHMPPTGTLRIYTVSGILVQEVQWTEQDLAGAGDLFFDLRTREGTEMASGLYLYMVIARDPATGAERKKVGRFIVIR